VSVPNAYQLNWTPRYFDTTIVAATVVEVINTDVDATRVTTIYNEIPAGYTIPTNTNSLGTQTVQVTYLRTGKTLTTEMYALRFDQTLLRQCLAKTFAEHSRHNLVSTPIGTNGWEHCPLKAPAQKPSAQPLLPLSP